MTNDDAWRRGMKNMIKLLLEEESQKMYPTPVTVRK
jgi:hypothetical protein